MNLFRRLWTALFQPKVEWKPTGIRYTHRGFDQSKGSAAYQRSRRQTPAGTPLRLTDTPTSRQDNVRTMNRKAL